MATAAGHSGDPVQLRRLSDAREAPARFVLTLWTNAPDLAARADAAGIDRVGLDLESIGKRDRQAGLGTWISPHSEHDLPALAAVLAKAQLFARTEPMNPKLGDQVERLIAAGVEVLMLPMFSSADDVARFVDHVAGRARVVLLLETAGAVERIDEILAVEGIDDIHLGLNDLALSIGARNRFEVLADAAVARAARAIVQTGVRFGAGGLGRVDDKSLPIPTDLIYAQYARLGATAALVSRAFLAPDPAQVDLDSEVARARRRLADWALRPVDELEAARTALMECAARSASW